MVIFGPQFRWCLQTRSQLPVRFVTVILTDQRCRIESQGSEIVIAHEKLHDESAKMFEYRVNLSAPAAKPSEPSSQRLFPVVS